MEAAKPFQVYDYLLILIAVIFAVLAAYPPFLGDSINSRLATVYSLTEQGNFTIAETPGDGTNPFEPGTVDKVQSGDRIISSKPPVLPLLMTGEYLLLRAALGWELKNAADVPAIAYVMTLTFVVAPYFVMLLVFARAMRLVVLDRLSCTVSLAALAFATQLWGYSITFNNHVPAVAMAVLAMYWALGVGQKRLEPHPLRFLGFGLATGLVLTVDLPAAVFPFIGACYLLWKFPAKLLTWGVLGGAIPVAVHALVLWAVTGSPLPVQMHKEMYLYESSYWRFPIGIDALNEPKAIYLFHMTFGRKGIFLLYPILLVGIVGLVMAIISKTTPQRGAIVAGGIGTAILIAYYTLSTNNYGGAAYGFRWLLPAMPVLLWMGAPLLDRTRPRWAWIAIGILMGISFYSAWQCTVTPWGVNREWTCRFLGPSF